MAASGPDFRLSVGSTLDGSVTANFAAFEKAGIKAGEGAARGLSRARKEVSKMESGLLKASHALEVFQGPLGGVASRLSASARLFSVASTGFAATFASLAGGGAALFAASDIQNQQVRLKSLAGSQDAYNVAQKETLRIAKETRSSLGDTIKLYSRLLINAQQYGLTQKQVGSVTTGVNITSQLQGLSTQESQASLNELTHALASDFKGVGQPLRLLARESPLLVKTIIDGLTKLNLEGFDGTIEGFRKFAAEGKLNSELVARAFEAMQGSLQDRLNASQVTLTQAVTGLKTSLSSFIIKLEESTHILARVGDGITFISNNLSGFGAAITIAGGALAARLIGPLISAGIEFVQFRAFLIAGTAEMAEISITSSAAGFGLTRLKSAVSGVVALLGGPWGIALAAAAGAAYYLSTRQDAVAVAADRMGISEGELVDKVNAATGAIGKQNGVIAQNLAGLNAIKRANAEKNLSDALGSDSQSRRTFGQALVDTGAAATLSIPEYKRLSNLITGGRPYTEIAAEIDKLAAKNKAFATAIVADRDFIDGKLLGRKSVVNELVRLGASDEAAMGAQQKLSDIGKVTPTATATVNGVSGISKVITDDQARVKALAKSGESLQLAAAKHKLAIDELNREFKDVTSKGDIEGDKAADYETRKQAIEDQYATEVRGIKDTAAAKHAASKQASADKTKEKRVADEIAKRNDLLNRLQEKYSNEPDLRKRAAADLDSLATENRKSKALGLPEFTEAELSRIKVGMARSVIKPITDANALEQAQIGIVNEQLAGREANAEALKRGYDYLKAGVALEDINLANIRDQVIAETKRNEVLALRNQLVDNYAKSFGQIQGAFTNLFAGGNIKDFGSQLSQTFKQNAAQKLSIAIFGNAEQDARDRMTGALNKSAANLNDAATALKAAAAYRDGTSSGASGSLSDQVTTGVTNGLTGSSFTGGLSDAFHQALTTPLTSALPANDNLAAGVVPGVAGNAAGIFANTTSSIANSFRDFQKVVTKATTDSTGQSFGTFGRDAGGKFGTQIGSVLDGLFGSSKKDASGNVIAGAGKLGQALGKAGETIGAAYEGYQLGQSAAGLVGVPKNTGAKVGGAVGATGGAIVGAYFGGPIGAAIGAAIGSFIGSAVGSIFGGVNPRAFKSLQIDGSGTALTSSQRTRGTDQAANLTTASSESDAYLSAINGLASSFNATLKPNTYLGEIGVYGGKYGFHSGVGDDKTPTQTFDTAEKAVAAAIQFAIQQGAFEGLRAGTAKLLSTGSDFNAQSTKASKYEQVFNDVAKATNPAAYAVKTLNTQFTGLAAIFKEAGATASDYATLQQDYDLQRATALQQANSQLKSFLDGLTTGASSGLSARDREAAAKAAFNPFAADIGAGKAVDQAAYQTAAQNLLDVERELNGSTSSYFDTLSQVTSLTTKVLDGNGATVGAALNLNPFAAGSTTTTPITNSLSALQAALLAQGSDTNAILSQILSGGIANNNGIAGGGSLALNQYVRNF
jgi:hypothetical protein